MASEIQVASLYAKLGADTSQFDRKMRKSRGVFTSFAGGVKTFAKVGLGAAVAGLTAFGAGMTAALKTSAQFEKTMSGAQAVLGATGEEMEKLNELALRLGKDTAFSAAEAASAIEMLAKNGVDAEKILNGMADATVALAAATSADLSTAADVATDAMYVFGIQADKVKDAINGISGVVVSSKFDINDYALALSQGGGVAANVGVSFEDFNATIAAISSAFGSGSDAGTSFKVFLQRLVPASKKAEGAMRQLGIITEDGKNRFFDAEGNLKSMTEIAGVLQEALAGLSDEQRNAALSAIFGTDAMRAAAMIAKTGAEGFEELLSKISEVDAMRQAATRLDNLAGDVEQLSGSFETLKIKLGKAFTPLARKGVQALTKQLNKLLELDFDAFANRFERVLDTLTSPGVVRTVKGLVSSLREMSKQLWKVVNPMREVFGGLFSRLSAAAQTGDPQQLLSAIGQELLALGKQFFHWLTATALPQLVKQLSLLGDKLFDWASELWTTYLWPGVRTMWSSLLGWVVGVARSGELQSKLGEAWTAFADWAMSQWPKVVEGLSGLFSNLKDWITSPDRFQTLASAVKEKWTAFKEWASSIWASAKEKLTAFFANLKDWITSPDRISELVNTVKEKWTAFTDWAGDAWENVKERLSTFFVNLKDWVTNPERRAELVNTVKEKWTAFADWAGSIWTKTLEKLTGFVTKLINWIKNPATWRAIGTWVKFKWRAFSDWAAGLWAKMKPKLVEMYNSLIQWLDEQKPGLGQKVDEWVQILASLPDKVRTAWEEDYASLQTTTNEFVTQLLAEFGRMKNALIILFGSDGQGGEVGGIWSGVEWVVKNVFQTLLDSILAVVGGVRFLLETLATVKQLASGEIGMLEALSQVKQSFDDWIKSGIRFEDIRQQKQQNQSPSTAPGGGSGGFGGAEGMSFGSAANVNVNIKIEGSGADLPSDRSKLLSLARAIWREAELAGLRMTS